MTLIARLDTFASRQRKIASRALTRIVKRQGVQALRASSRLSRRTAHLTALRFRKVQRVARIGLERARNAPVAVRNLSRKAAVVAWGLRRPFMRWRASRRRVREKWVALRAEISLDEQIERFADADAIVVGPWLSEVGFETLYWVPFVRWFRATYHVKPDRMLVLTRGGAACWYADITPNHVEIFDLVTPEAFAAHNAARSDAPGGTIKQLELSSPFERDLVDRAQAQWGFHGAQVLHPALMYRLFQQFWAGNRPLSFLDEHTRYGLVASPSDDVIGDGALPDDYVAVKLYSAQSLQDTPDTRRLLADLLGSIAEQYPLVLLDTGLALDDHGEFEFVPRQRVVSARAWMESRTNLAVQTRIIAGARAFVGTCGSVAWLAPMLGTDTTAVMTDAKFLNVHLHVARRVYRVMGGGRFTPLDLGGLAPLGLGVTAAGRGTHATSLE
jgi:hypothetical protein